MTETGKCQSCQANAEEAAILNLREQGLGIDDYKAVAAGYVESGTSLCEQHEEG